MIQAKGEYNRMIYCLDDNQNSLKRADVKKWKKEILFFFSYLNVANIWNT